MKTDYPVLEILKKHIPERAWQWCYMLWEENHFKLKITKKRDSKLGDYRYIPSTKSHIITLNNDLNPYAFLVTYIHEVAHLKTTIRYGHKVKPHGNEWKTIFRELLNPLLKNGIFPASVQIPLAAYISNPKASSCNDLSLQKALRDFDPHTVEIYLSEANRGDTFRFNKRYFIKEETKRSRAICREVHSGKRYFIPESALIEQVGQMSLLF